VREHIHNQIPFGTHVTECSSFFVGGCGKRPIQSFVESSQGPSGDPLHHDTSYKVGLAHERWYVCGALTGGAAQRTERSLPIARQMAVNRLPRLRRYLGRSQHLVLLLADWMAAIMIQAVFYGKSQFGVKEKVRIHSIRTVSGGRLLLKAVDIPKSCVASPHPLIPPLPPTIQPMSMSSLLYARGDHFPDKQLWFPPVVLWCPPGDTLWFPLGVYVLVLKKLTRDRAVHDLFRSRPWGEYLLRHGLQRLSAQK